MQGCAFFSSCGWAPLVGKPPWIMEGGGLNLCLHTLHWSFAHFMKPKTSEEAAKRTCEASTVLRYIPGTVKFTSKILVLKGHSRPFKADIGNIHSNLS